METMVMIDVPGPFSPRTELEAFVRRMKARADADSSQVQSAIAEAEEYLQNAQTRD